MKGVSNAKLILLLLHSKQIYDGSRGGIHSLVAFSGSNHCICLITAISFFTFTCLFILLTTAPAISCSPAMHVNNHLSLSSLSLLVAIPSTFPADMYDALLHYATSYPTATSSRMLDSDLQAIATVIRHRAPCNLLIFGRRFEFLFWQSHNHGGLTVILDEKEYYIKPYEGHHLGLEVYHVAYVTKVSKLHDLLRLHRRPSRGCHGCCTRVGRHGRELAWTLVPVGRQWARLNPIVGAWSQAQAGR